MINQESSESCGYRNRNQRPLANPAGKPVRGRTPHANTPTSLSMIEIAGLTKNFGPIVAVDGIDLSVGRGEVLGFLGPNGAGKSTTMKMVTGYLTPSSGSVK